MRQSWCEVCNDKQGAMLKSNILLKFVDVHIGDVFQIVRTSALHEDSESFGVHISNWTRFILCRRNSNSLILNFFINFGSFARILERRSTKFLMQNVKHLHSAYMDQGHHPFNPIPKSISNNAIPYKCQPILQYSMNSTMQAVHCFPFIQRRSYNWEEIWEQLPPDTSYHQTIAMIYPDDQFHWPLIRNKMSPPNPFFFS